MIHCKWTDECDVLCYDDPFGGVSVQLLNHSGMDKMFHYNMEPEEAVEFLVTARNEKNLRFPEQVLTTLSEQPHEQ